MQLSNEIEIKEIIYGSDEYELSLDFRNEIFRKPQGLNIRDDDLEYEKNAMMFGAWLNKELIGTIFLQDYKEDTARIRSVAVKKSFRNIGLGKKLMQFIEALALQNGYKKIYLTARQSVCEFYIKLGYKVIGNIFLYKKVPHVEMEKKYDVTKN